MDNFTLPRHAGFGNYLHTESLFRNVHHMANPPHQNPLTKNVRLAIFEAGVSRAKVAGALGVTPRTLYSKLRTGKFTVEQLQAVAKVTGTTVNDLLPDEAKAAS